MKSCLPQKITNTVKSFILLVNANLVVKQKLNSKWLKDLWPVVYVKAIAYQKLSNSAFSFADFVVIQISLAILR